MKNVIKLQFHFQNVRSNMDQEDRSNGMSIGSCFVMPVFYTEQVNSEVKIFG
jgi:hypothetical protein